jgi:hypothetical protein
MVGPISIYLALFFRDAQSLLLEEDGLVGMSRTLAELYPESPLDIIQVGPDDVHNCLKAGSYYLIREKNPTSTYKKALSPTADSYDINKICEELGGVFPQDF